MNARLGKFAFLFLLTVGGLILCPLVSNSEEKFNQSTVEKTITDKNPFADKQPHKISKYSGEKTTLVLDAKFWMLRHDCDDYGHTTITLLSKDGSLLFKKELDDNISCLGYSHERHAFILGSTGECHSYPATVSVRYVPEDKPGLVSSKSFNGKYIAVESIPSPDLRFIVFVGHRWEPPIWRLYVLDTSLDTVRLLGKAPEPAPFSKEDIARKQAGSNPNDHQDPCMDWQWGWAPSLEPGICKFIAPHVLQVSYGKDTCRYRSKNRIIQKWKL